MIKLFPILCVILAPALLLGRADENATPAADELFQQLVDLQSIDGAIFGSQYSLFQGVRPDGSGWKNERGEMIYSDAKNIAGVHAGIVGWDFNGMWKPYLYPIQVVQAHSLGAIITFSYHMGNPATGGNYHDKNVELSQLLPGGDAHETFKTKWSFAADFIERLEMDNGELVPIILRPYHEMSGTWFWWGSQNSVEDFVALWQWTVEYLRDERGLHNILYCYSPDTVSSKQEYLTWYPGDDYVDLLGLDYYRTDNSGNSGFINVVKILTDVAKEKEMPAALTEIGHRSGMGGTSIKDWWLSHVWQPLADEALFDDLAFISGWANWNQDNYFMPYPGDPTADPFAEFVRKDEILMLDYLNPDAVWTNFPGVGWIYTKHYPWVYHINQGWWYMQHTFGPETADSQWYFDPQIGWFYTSDSYYPNQYSVDHGWLYYTGTNSAGTRFFYSYAQDADISFPAE